jgi:hypothetical protein
MNTSLYFKLRRSCSMKMLCVPCQGALFSPVQPRLFRYSCDSRSVWCWRGGARSWPKGTRRSCQRGLDHKLNAIMVLAPINLHGRWLQNITVSCEAIWSIWTFRRTTTPASGN